jgi:glyoxylase-like metal-dependent hydrolase (beta-lactamase superfamily II)
MWIFVVMEVFMVSSKSKIVPIVLTLTSAAVLVVIAFLFIFPAVTASSSQPRIIKSEGWTQINDDIFVSSESYDTQGKINITLVVSGNEAALIDTGYSKAEAQRCLDYIENNHLKLKYVFITHLHTDHIVNLSLFKNPEVTVYDFPHSKDGQTVKMGDKTFKIIFTKGHYYDQHLSVEIVEDKVLAAGDVVVTDILPLLNYGGNMKSLIETLENIKQNNYSLIIPGHGDLYDTQKTIAVNLDYLIYIRKAVGDIIKSGGTAKDLTNIKAQDCLKDISHLNPKYIDREHAADLNKAFSELK